MIKHNVSFVVLIFALPFVVGFCRNKHIIPRAEAFSTTMIVASPVKNVRGKQQQQQQQQQQQLPTSGNLIPAARLTMLLSMSDDNDNNSQELMISESDQMLLGALGTFASLVTLYSEFTLKTTGCGLPAGPFGLVGLVEGLSYLGVTGIFAYSIVTKVKTGSGLPAGPSGLLGAAEGLSFLAIGAGLIVLILQVTNFGYIPNAIPMEGGMCS